MFEEGHWSLLAFKVELKNQFFLDVNSALRLELIPLTFLSLQHADCRSWDFSDSISAKTNWELNHKESAYNTEDLGLIPRSGRSPGEGNGNTLQYSGLGNPMDRGAWWAIVRRVSKESDTT